MQLIGFTIKDFRSIIGTHKIPIENYTIIVGPNNEGKSNLLRGLGLALNSLTNPRIMRYGNRLSFPNTRRYEKYDYNWERDYPVGLQDDKDGSSQFTLEFQLTAEESNYIFDITEKSDIKRINFKTIFDTKRKIEIRSGSYLFPKNIIPDLYEYLSSKVAIQYIPSIRTESLTENVVNDLLEKELSTLEDNEDYQDAIENLINVQKPILDRIASELTSVDSRIKVA